MTNGTRSGWGVSVTPRPLFTPGKDPVLIVQEARWAPGPVWTGAEYLAPIGIRSPDCPARSHSLYRLSHPAHCLKRETKYKTHTKQRVKMYSFVHFELFLRPRIQKEESDSARVKSDRFTTHEFAWWLSADKNYCWHGVGCCQIWQKLPWGKVSLVSFIMSPSIASLSHRKPASVRISCDSSLTDRYCERYIL